MLDPKEITAIIESTDKKDCISVLKSGLRLNIPRDLGMRLADYLVREQKKNQSRQEDFNAAIRRHQERFKNAGRKGH